MRFGNDPLNSLHQIEKYVEGTNELTPEAQERQRKGLRWNRIALITFIVVQTLYVLFAVYSVFMMITGWEKVTDFDDNGKLDRRQATLVNGKTYDIKGGSQSFPPLTPKARGVYFIATGSALAFNLVLLATMRWMAGIYVWLGPALLVLFLAAGTGVAAWKKAYFIAAVWGAFIPLVGLFVYLLYGRIKLGKYLLEITGRIAAKSSNVYTLTLVGLIVQFLLACLNIFAMVGCFLTFQPIHEGCSTQKFPPCSWTVMVIGCLFLLGAHTWLSAWIGNLVLMGLAGGPFSTYYFEGKSGTVGAFKALGKSIKHSKGTVAFGTLFVGLVHLLNGLFGIVADTHAEGFVGILIQILAIILRPIIAMIDALLQTFNKYAYIFVAIGKREIRNNSSRLVIDPYEETYWEAGCHCLEFVMRRPKRKTGQSKEAYMSVLHQFTRNCGISVIINDDITSTALFMACLATAMLSAFLTWIYMASTTGEMTFKKWYDWMAVYYAFVLGLMIGLVTTSALEIGVSTLFVCLSEDISKLKALDPEFYCFLRWKYAGMFLREGMTLSEPLGIHAQIEFIKNYGSDGDKDDLSDLELKAKAYGRDGQKQEMTGPSGPHLFNQ